jgi:putative ABC transport system permease protein
MRPPRREGFPSVMTIVLSGILHRRLRSLAAILTLAFTLAVLTLCTSGLRRVELLAHRAPEFVAIIPANPWLDLPLAAAARVVKVPGVVAAEYYSEHFATDGTPRDDEIGTLVSASDGYFRMVAPERMSVSAELEERWRTERQGLIANPVTARRMGWHPGDLINVNWKSLATGQAWVTPFKLLGIYEGVQRDNLVAHYEYVDQLLSPDHRQRADVIAAFRDASSGEGTDRAIDQLLKSLPDPALAATSNEWTGGAIAGELTTVRVLEQLGSLMLAITCAVVGAALSMSLRERRTEIGALRALGFTRARVLQLILSESMVVGLAGYVLGVLIPTVLLALAGRGIDLGPQYLAGIRPGAVELLIAAAAVTVVAVGVSAWPAWSASHQDVVEALQEG